MSSDHAQPNQDGEDRVFRAFAPPVGNQPTWFAPPLPPAPKADINGFAITSLVFGILGFACCLWVVGIGFGIAALKSIRERGQRGKGLAVAGLALSGFWIVSTVLGLLLAFYGQRFLPVTPHAPGGGSASRAGTVSVLGLVAGDCFEPVDPTPQSTRVKVVPCSHRHHGEVFGSTSLTEIQFPGEKRLSAEAWRACTAQRSDYALDTDALPRRVDVRFYFADEAAWGRTSGHRATCAFVDRNGDRVGSLRQDSRRLTAEQSAYLHAVSRVRTELVTEPLGDITAANQAERAIWARDLAASVDAELETLESTAWSERAKQPIADLAAELRQMQPHLAAAQQATHPAGITRELAAALGHAGEQQTLAVRAALGLPADPATAPQSSSGAVGAV